MPYLYPVAKNSIHQGAHSTPPCYWSNSAVPMLIYLCQIQFLSSGVLTAEFCLDVNGVTRFEDHYIASPLQK